MAALIITASDEVLPAIQKMTNRSATYWGGIRYYTKSDCKVILMELLKYEGISINQTIKQIDDHAFVTFFKVDAIVGNFNKHL